MGLSINDSISRNNLSLGKTTGIAKQQATARATIPAEKIYKGGELYTTDGIWATGNYSRSVMISNVWDNTEPVYGHYAAKLMNDAKQTMAYLDIETGNLYENYYSPQQATFETWTPEGSDADKSRYYYELGLFSIYSKCYNTSFELGKLNQYTKSLPEKIGLILTTTEANKVPSSKLYYPGDVYASNLIAEGSSLKGSFTNKIRVTDKWISGDKVASGIYGIQVKQYLPLDGILNDYYNLETGFIYTNILKGSDYVSAVLKPSDGRIYLDYLPQFADNLYSLKWGDETDQRFNVVYYPAHDYIKNLVKILLNKPENMALYQIPAGKLFFNDKDAYVLPFVMSTVTNSTITMKCGVQALSQFAAYGHNVISLSDSSGSWQGVSNPTPMLDLETGVIYIWHSADGGFSDKNRILPPAKGEPVTAYTDQLKVLRAMLADCIKGTAYANGVTMAKLNLDYLDGLIRKYEPDWIKVRRPVSIAPQPVRINNSAMIYDVMGRVQSRQGHLPRGVAAGAHVVPGRRLHISIEQK